MSTNNNKPLLLDIALMRPILIISICFGHAFAMFGGSSSWPLLSSVNPINAYSYITPTAISFALQAFVFISGYLFAYKHSSASPSNKRKFVAGKFKRIYLPSIIFSVCYLLLLHPTSFYSLSVVYEIINGAGHLWFLPMLFLCYVFGCLFYKKISEWSLWKMFLLIAISLCASACLALVGDILRVLTGVQYFLYFAMGMWVCRHRTTILNYVKSRKHILLVIGWLVICLLCVVKIKLQTAPMTDDIIEKALLLFLLNSDKLLLGIIGSVVLWSTINVIVKGENIKIRGDVWYGLYIYHQFLLMYIYYHTPIASYVGSIWLPWIVFAITVILSYAFVVLTLKTKVGRWLIG